MLKEKENMNKKIFIPICKIFGVPSRFKWEKSLNEWMGLGAKITAYLLNKYGEEEVIAFWDYNIEVMIPFWEKQNIRSLGDFIDAMIFLSEVTNTKIRIEKKENHEALAIVLECGFKDSIDKYRELVEVPENFPCEQWCKPFWAKISDSLGYICLIEKQNDRCQFVILDPEGEKKLKEGDNNFV